MKIIVPRYAKAEHFSFREGDLNDRYWCIPKEKIGTPGDYDNYEYEVTKKWFGDL